MAIIVALCCPPCGFRDSTKKTVFKDSHTYICTSYSLYIPRRLCTMGLYTMQFVPISNDGAFPFSFRFYALSCSTSTSCLPFPKKNPQTCITSRSMCIISPSSGLCICMYVYTHTLYICRLYITIIYGASASECIVVLLTKKEKKKT